MHGETEEGGEIKTAPIDRLLRAQHMREGILEKIRINLSILLILEALTTRNHCPSPKVNKSRLLMLECSDRIPKRAIPGALYNTRHHTKIILSNCRDLVKFSNSRPYSVKKEKIPPIPTNLVCLHKPSADARFSFYDDIDYTMCKLKIWAFVEYLVSELPDDLPFVVH